MRLSTTGSKAIGTLLIVFGIVLGGTTYINYKDTGTLNLQQPAAEVTITPIVTPAPTPSKEIKLTRLTVNQAQVVALDQPVTEPVIKQVISELDSVLENYDAAYLTIDSPGGAVFAGVMLTDYIKTSKKPIYTVCISVCASMAAHVFNYGKVRYITGTGVVMHHQISGGLRGNLSEMAATMHYIKRLSERMDREVAARSKMTYEQFRVKVLENVWADVEEAITLGLADKAVILEVTNKRKEERSLFQFLTN